MQFSLVALIAAGLAAAAPQATPTTPTNPATTSTPPTTTCTPGAVVDYVVVADDTLTVISQKLHSGICNIAKANNLANPNFLSLGQQLKVPTFPCQLDNTSCLAKPSQNLACVKGGKQGWYTIAKGDTFFLVAQSFQLDVNALLKANQGVDPLLLQVGQNITIPIC
ncbi:intracellular hyphae protein 1 [Magnaporthiopsis poae ATCC 64411]|uniref:Intracellular hyphae protein 1 n=1 Tax=Magnaporthiopsis poae (strain ATCC 64411 / 73-15) TaxID=644358 RepID=A0A0C4DU29_MAGP6|nr:intracellular hyphae protein 1 [Magnaporthiopsis poae ATCC 64411]